MKYKLTTYKTITGSKEIVQTLQSKNTQWVIYRDDKPKYFVDIFDLKTESNVIMNSLVLSARESICEVLKRISKKNNVNLSVRKTPRLGIKTDFKIIDLKLSPLPESWVSYSL